MHFPFNVEKQTLRREMRVRLDTLQPADRARFSQTLCERLAAHPAYANAKTVAIFAPLKSEPDVELLWKIAPRRFAYPRVAGEGLELVEIADLSLMAKIGTRTFREPPGVGFAKALPLSEIDLILVPGLAFTHEGHRVGRGGGYYDRLLAALPAKTPRIGVCFECQIVETIPTEPHDVRVDAVVTETG